MQTGKTDTVIQRELNVATPGLRDAHLGDVIYDLLAGYNDLAAKYAALLAHLDTANVANVGSANAATYSPAKPVLTLPAAR